MVGGVLVRPADAQPVPGGTGAAGGDSSPGGTTGAEELFGGRRVLAAAPEKCSTAAAAPSGAGLLAMGFPPKPHCRPGAGAAARSSCLVRVSALQRSPVTA